MSSNLADGAKGSSSLASTSERVLRPTSPTSGYLIPDTTASESSSLTSPAPRASNAPFPIPSTWSEPPTSTHSKAQRRRSSISSSTSTSSSDISSLDSWTSSRIALEDEKQWNESVRQLQLILNIVLIPYVAKWLGRKWAYNMFGRWQVFGFSDKRFWLGNW